MKKILTILIVGLGTLCSSWAQNSEYKWGADLQVGVEQYKGELGSGFYRFGQDLNGFIGLSVSRYLSPRFDLVGGITYGDISYDNEVDPVVFTRRNMFTASLQGRFNILTDEYKLRPYIFAGYGHMRFADGSVSQANTIIPYGLGLTYQVKPNIALRLQNTFIYSDFDRIDSDPSEDLNDSYLQHSIALSFNFGKTKNDMDNDGVADEVDQCPGEAGSAETNGCPDSDGDGIADKDDYCPNVAGTAGTKGCPDSDADGIADKDDKCPNTPGIAKNSGCPEITADEIKVFQDALHGINFKTGKGVIEESSYPILDKVVKIMNAHSAYNLLIEGHTDSQGDDTLNKNLSEKRANAVKTYLVNNGIDASRLKAKGYGEAKPVADNGTSEGRAENRRVELKVQF